MIAPMKLRFRRLYENLLNALYIYVISIFRPAPHIREKLKSFDFFTLFININHITISDQLLYQAAEPFFLVELWS